MSGTGRPATNAADSVGIAREAGAHGVCDSARCLSAAFIAWKFLRVSPITSFVKRPTSNPEKDSVCSRWVPPATAVRRMQCVPSKTPRIHRLPRQQSSCSGRTSRTVGLNTIESGSVPSTIRIVSPSLKSPSTRVMKGFHSGYAALFDTIFQTSVGGRSIRTSARALPSWCMKKMLPITPTTLTTMPFSSSLRKPIFARWFVVVVSLQPRTGRLWTILTPVSNVRIWPPPAGCHPSGSRPARIDPIRSIKFLQTGHSFVVACNKATVSAKVNLSGKWQHLRQSQIPQHIKYVLRGTLNVPRTMCNTEPSPQRWAQRTHDNAPVG